MNNKRDNQPERKTQQASDTRDAMQLRAKARHRSIWLRTVSRHMTHSDIHSGHCRLISPV